MKHILRIELDEIRFLSIIWGLQNSISVLWLCKKSVSSFSLLDKLFIRESKRIDEIEKENDKEKHFAFFT
jgi:hypothetical protein